MEPRLSYLVGRLEALAACDEAVDEVERRMLLELRADARRRARRL